MLRGMTATKEARRRGILLLAMVVLALLGVADGWYLSMVHVDYELGMPSELTQVCGKLSARGCAVTAGRFGTFLDVPISLWGLGGAAATALAAAMAWRNRDQGHDPWRGLAFALAAISVLASVLMGTLSTLEGSYCPFCVIWYGINLALGVCAWLSLGYVQDTSLGRLLKDAMGVPGLAALTVFMLTFSVAYWGYGQRRAEVRAKVQQDLDALVTKLLEAEDPVEVSIEGMPTKGPEDAPLTVVEIADFQCPHCRKLWQGVSEYTKGAKHPVRVAFVHYPLDDGCNPGLDPIHPLACDAAVAAECARQQEKFFEYGDLLFANQPAFAREELIGYARELGLDEAAFSTCLDGKEAIAEVKRSIARAILMEVAATPTFYVNGYEFRGAKPPDWIQLVFDRIAQDATKGTK